MYHKYKQNNRIYAETYYAIYATAFLQRIALVSWPVRCFVVCNGGKFFF
jgi:hypothetical protein